MMFSENHQSQPPIDPTIETASPKNLDSILIPLLIVVATIFIVVLVALNYYRSIEYSINTENRLLMLNTKERIENYFHDLYAQLLFISLDEHVKNMDTESKIQIQGFFDHQWEYNRLSEIYLIKRDFDGSRRPFMTFEHEEEERKGLHDAERETEEYQIQIEQISRFQENPELKSQLSPVIKLCLEAPDQSQAEGVVLSVPVIKGEELVGILAAMIPVHKIESELKLDNRDLMPLLIEEGGESIGCSGFPHESMAWLRKQFQSTTVEDFFQQQDDTFEIGKWTSIYTPIDIAPDQKWWLVLQYDEKALTKKSNHPFLTRFWISFGGIMLTGFLLATMARLTYKRLEEKLATSVKHQVMMDNLSESENKYQQLFDSETDAILVFDAATFLITDANQSALKLYGYQKEELLGLAVSDLSAEPELTMESLDHASTDQIPFIPIRIHKKKDGTEFPIEVSSGLFTHNKRKMVCGIIRDITDRIKSEQLLKLSEERYRHLFTRMHDGFALHELICDEAGHPIDYRFLEVNQAFEKITNLHNELIIGRTALELGLPIDPKLLQKYGEVALGRSSTRFEYFFEDIQTHVEILAYSPLPKQFALIITDISRRKELEEQLQHSVKMDAIGQLAGGIAHDFNNLLVGILGNASLLKQDFDPHSPHFATINTLEQAAERASELTRQLLGFSRQGKYQVLPTDIHNTIITVVNLLQGTLDQNIMISMKLSAPESTVVGDPGQLEQAIMNLAINARQAMDKSGELSIYTEVVEVEEAYCLGHSEATPGRYVKVTVSDTGCGIPDELRKKIFEPYFTTRENESGNGLGLAMVYGITNNHKGFLEFNSVLGKGTDFAIYLPLTDEKAAPKTPPHKEVVKSGQGRILLVDDQEVVREVASKMLSKMGYTVITACDGREGADIYRASFHEIDVVLLDMIMPEMDGEECFAELKKINSDVKVILSTGYGLEGKAQEILKNGALDFVQKPYKMAQLSKAVAQALKFNQ